MKTEEKPIQIFWLIPSVVIHQNPGGGGAKLESIFPNQVKMSVKTEKRSIYYHKDKDILKKIDLFLWILELYRLILVLTIFFVETKFHLGDKVRFGLEGKPGSGGRSCPCPIANYSPVCG